MSDRKRYSKRREEMLWRVADRAIIDFRIAILSGKLDFYGGVEKERAAHSLLSSLPDQITAEYRRSYAKPPTEGEE